MDFFNHQYPNSNNNNNNNNNNYPASDPLAAVYQTQSQTQTQTQNQRYAIPFQKITQHLNNEYNSNIFQPQSFVMGMPGRAINPSTIIASTSNSGSSPSPLGTNSNNTASVHSSNSGSIHSSHSSGSSPSVHNNNEFNDILQSNNNNCNHNSNNQLIMPFGDGNVNLADMSLSSLYDFPRDTGMNQWDCINNGSIQGIQSSFICNDDDNNKISDDMFQLNHLIDSNPPLSTMDNKIYVNNNTQNDIPPINQLFGVNQSYTECNGNGNNNNNNCNNNGFGKQQQQQPSLAGVNMNDIVPAIPIHAPTFNVNNTYNIPNKFQTIPDNNKADNNGTNGDESVNNYVYNSHGDIIGIIDSSMSVINSKGIKYNMIRPLTTNININKEIIAKPIVTNKLTLPNIDNADLPPVVMDIDNIKQEINNNKNGDKNKNKKKVNNNRKKGVIRKRKSCNNDMKIIPKVNKQRKTITRSTMKRGRHISDDEKPFVCKTCGKGYKYLCNYRSHCKIHTDDAFVCSFCNKRFGRKSNYKEHVRIHTGESPYKCQYCDRTFKQHHGWKDHLRVHTGEKPYLCKICGKRFTVGHNLNVHMRIHTGERPYNCDICKKSYRQKSAYNSHIKNVHGLKIKRKAKGDVTTTNNRQNNSFNDNMNCSNGCK